MAIELSFDDLKKSVDEQVAEKGVYFKAKDGKKVTLRPLMLLNDAELKVVKTLMESVSKEQDKDEQDVIRLGESINQILVAAADVKESLKKSLAELPFETRIEIFNAWMGGDEEQGEASDSES